MCVRARATSFACAFVHALLTSHVRSCARYFFHTCLCLRVRLFVWARACVCLYLYARLRFNSFGFMSTCKLVIRPMPKTVVKNFLSLVMRSKMFSIRDHSSSQCVSLALSRSKLSLAPIARDVAPELEEGERAHKMPSSRNNQGGVALFISLPRPILAPAHYITLSPNE